MSLETGNLGKQFKDLGKRLAPYRGLAFFLLVALMYGFIIFRINALSTATPSDSALSEATQATTQPHIDPAVVQKIQDLQDNSVNVQSLFKPERENPFQE